MNDIKNREDIKLLVTIRQRRRRESKEIGYFFNETIANRAKNNARKMASHLYPTIFESR